jgi:multiple sugar transport system substrate-binding protein
MEEREMSSRLRLSALSLAAILVAAACTSGGGPSPTSGATQSGAPPASAGSGSPSTGEQLGIDDGTALTMWTRAATEARATALVEAYNGAHQNQIELRIVPTDDYQTVVGAAAPNNELPDLFSADVVFMPNWTSQGLFTDLTERIDALPYIDNVGQAHIIGSTWEERKYGLPFIIDLSVWMYNKKLFRDAGLDPEAPPATLEEFAEAARAVDALGGDVHGTFFGGNCGGCNVFTWWPISWAEGEPVMNPEGTEALLNSDAMKEIYRTFGALWDEGVIHPDSQAEAGPTWTGYFPQGTIGIMPMPASLQGMANENLADEDIGVTAIGGLTTGQSTFVGGDSIGISKDSQHIDQAWNFLAWLLDDDAQVEVVAQGGNVVARTDLADNEYSAADPRLVIFNEIAGQGETPFALKFGQTYNDPQGPWIPLFRAAVFDDADDATIDQLNQAVNDSLQP